MIYLKSVQKPPGTRDGIRICIMREPGPEVQFDIWIPTLAPSRQLLTQYHHRAVTWEQFEQRFTQEVLFPKNKYLTLLLDLAKKETITLLCWEQTPTQCHRRLVGNYLHHLDPTITIRNK